MSNQWAKASKNVPHIFGGNVNSTLKTWLDKLGVKDFVHAQLEVHSIDPRGLELSALYFTKTYIGYECMFTVGKIADKVFTLAGLDHGALPNTNAPKKEVDEALNNCRNYLTRRMYYAPSTSNSPISS